MLACRRVHLARAAHLSRCIALTLRCTHAARRRFGPGLAWYVPLGLAGWFAGLGITNVTELDWWQEVQHPGSKVWRG